MLVQRIISIIFIIIFFDISSLFIQDTNAYSWVPAQIKPWLKTCPNGCFKNVNVEIGYRKKQDVKCMENQHDACVCKYENLIFKNLTVMPSVISCDQIAPFGDVQKNGEDLLSKALFGNGFDLTSASNFPKYTQITDRGVKILVKEGYERYNMKANWLDFHYNNLTDDSMNFISTILLQETTKVKRLDLQSNQIGPRGAIMLAKALETNTVLEYLNLAENEVRAEGAKALGEMLAKNSHLKALLLFQDTISEASARGLADAFRKRTFSRNAEIMFDVKGHNYQMGRNDIMDQGLANLAYYLRNNTVLEFLDVGECLIGPSGANAIANTLMLRKNMSMCNGTLCHPNSPIKSGIKTLRMGWNKIKDLGVSYLAEMLKVNNVLEELDLGHNYAVEILDVSQRAITDEGAKMIASALHNNTGLKKLVLWSNLIGDQGALALADALKHNVTTLEYLDLSNNLIGDVGALALGEALETYPHMIELDLRGNMIGQVRDAKFRTVHICMDGKDTGGTCKNWKDSGENYKNFKVCC